MHRCMRIRKQWRQEKCGSAWKILREFLSVHVHLHAAQGGLRAGAAGFAQGDELGRDFDYQDIRSRDVGRLELRLGLGHDGPPFRPVATVAAVGESKPYRAQARQGLVARVSATRAPGMNARMSTPRSRVRPLALPGLLAIRKAVGTRRLGAPHPAIADQQIAGSMTQPMALRSIGRCKTRPTEKFTRLTGCFSHPRCGAGARGSMSPRSS
jgi:hypothetical protein